MTSNSGRRTILEAGDEIVLAGPSTTLVRAGASIGPEIEGAEVLREVQGDALGVLVNNRALHGRSFGKSPIGSAKTRAAFSCGI